jgi:hypothetical protein
MDDATWVSGELYTLGVDGITHWTTPTYGKGATFSFPGENYRLLTTDANLLLLIYIDSSGVPVVGLYDTAYNKIPPGMVGGRGTDLSSFPDDRLRLVAFPNPFNHSTFITVNASALAVNSANASIRIYNACGGLVKELYSGTLKSGPHNLIWNGTDNFGKSVPSGFYIFKLQSANISREVRGVLRK